MRVYQVGLRAATCIAFARFDAFGFVVRAELADCVTLSTFPIGLIVRMTGRCDVIWRLFPVEFLMKWSAWFSAFSGIDADLSTTVTRQPCVSSRLIDGLAMIATIRIVVIILIALQSYCSRVSKPKHKQWQDQE